MTEFNSAPPVAADQPGSMGAGADIYRRLDRRPRRSTMKYATPVIALAIILGGGAAAYVMLRPAAAPQPVAPPAPAQMAQAAAPQIPPAPAVHIAETPPPAEAVTARSQPIVHRTAPTPRLAVQAVRPRPHRTAPSAASSGEDASVYQPVAPLAPPPAATTAAPPAAPVTLPPPPAPPPSTSSTPTQPPS
jgi:hypothetical protein